MADTGRSESRREFTHIIIERNAELAKKKVDELCGKDWKVVAAAVDPDVPGRPYFYFILVAPDAMRGDGE